ncbi:hypothetical protein PoB_007637800 [Plakobranchus ocellatus]|uniref:Uncharacterized protein n=1 Tax=Plakobranchus ocellatus TaxID=259542 RepID=A0AAV4DZW2_9GAST|nr:hypothetical protein PoB_007637800 [Plakobranchus ocellatus]
MCTKTVQLDKDYGGYTISQYVVTGVTPEGATSDVTTRPPYTSCSGFIPIMKERRAEYFRKGTSQILTLHTSVQLNGLLQVRLHHGYLWDQQE